MIDYILFDLSEVFITGLYGTHNSIAKANSISQEEVMNHLGKHVTPLFEGHISEDEYWKRVLSEGDYGIDISHAKKLLRENFREYPDGAIEILPKLQGKVKAIGLLSDHTKEWIEDIEERFSFMQLFDTKCYSFEAKCTKLDVKSFLYALEKMGAQPSKTLFVDDYDKNLKVAKTAGISYVHHFKNASLLEDDLKRLGVL